MNSKHPSPNPPHKKLPPGRIQGQFSYFLCYCSTSTSQSGNEVTLDEVIVNFFPLKTVSLAEQLCQSSDFLWFCSFSFFVSWRARTEAKPSFSSSSATWLYHYQRGNTLFLIMSLIASKCSKLHQNSTTQLTPTFNKDFSSVGCLTIHKEVAAAMTPHFTMCATLYCWLTCILLLRCNM